MDRTRELGKPESLIRLRLGDYLLHTSNTGDLASYQTAVSLLRTVFEDHYVDPEHRSCLFFHGCTIQSPQRESHDFTVVHRQGRVMLSDFTFERRGPSCVSLPLEAYAREVVGFAERILHAEPAPQQRPEWQEQLYQTQRRYLTDLLDLGRRLVASGCEPYEIFCTEFYHIHGRLKRPLILDVLCAGAEDRAESPEPPLAEVRILFGPLSVQQRIPMRLNGGDVVLVSVERFSLRGALVKVEGVGSGGLRPGDQLFGLQLFYP